MEHEFETRGLRFAAERQLIGPGQNVLVALSGGADSVALLSFLYRNREALQIASLSAAHVHHGIRGEEADRDAAFCEALCKQWQIPFVLQSVDVPHVCAQTHESLETAARRLRYEVLLSVAQEKGALLATAHTLSDNTETVLQHLARGCGLTGLKGISEKRESIIRPILFSTREEVEAYCEDLSLHFVHDSSNDDLAYSRNRIRKNVIPQLKHINEGLDKTLWRMCDSLRKDDVCLTTMAEELLEKAVREDERLDCSVFLKYEKPVRTRAFRLWLPTIVDFEQKHFDSLDNLLTDSGALTLPGNLQVRSQNGLIGLEGTQAEPFCICLEIGKPIPIGETIFFAKLYSRNQFDSAVKVNNLLTNSCLDYDTLSGEVFVRSRQNGDAYHPVSRGGKTLKKLFNEKNIPVYQRNSIPVLCDAEGIVMVSGFGCDERVKLTSDTQSILVFTTHKNFKE